MKPLSHLINPAARQAASALLALSLLLAASVGLNAQPANPGAPGGAGRGAGGRGAATPPPRVDTLSPYPAAMQGLLSVAQQKSLDAITQATADLGTAATAARQALTAASFALPSDPTDLRTKAAALAATEQALAFARSERFAVLQAGPEAIPAESRAGAVARLGAQPGGRGGQTRQADDMLGFVSIFDGKTLTGWDGDPNFWKVENGVITAESTPENPVTRNTFLIWRGATVKDFELKAEFRMSGTNSGIQYRSREYPEVGKWVLGGYQADMDANNTFTGGMAEERGRRNSMVPRGQMIRVTGDGAFKVLGTMAEPTEIASAFVLNGWNTYHIIAKGNVLMHILNGRVSVVMIDEDEAARAMEGVIGLQMHTGAPFKVEFRNLMYRAL